MEQTNKCCHGVLLPEQPVGDGVYIRSGLLYAFVCWCVGNVGGFCSVWDVCNCFGLGHVVVWWFFSFCFDHLVMRFSFSNVVLFFLQYSFWWVFKTILLAKRVFIWKYLAKRGISGFPRWWFGPLVWVRLRSVVMMWVALLFFSGVVTVFSVDVERIFPATLPVEVTVLDSSSHRIDAVGVVSGDWWCCCCFCFAAVIAFFLVLFLY